MKIGSLLKNLMELSLAKAQPARQELRPGDRLEGRVIEVGAGGHARIDFGAFRARAEVRFPVQVGQRLPVEVSGTGTQLVLRLRSETNAAVAPAAASLIVARLELPKAAELTRVVERIQQLLSRDAAAGPPIKADHAQAAHAITASVTTPAKLSSAMGFDPAPHGQKASPAMGFTPAQPGQVAGEQRASALPLAARAETASVTRPAAAALDASKALDAPRIPMALRQALETIVRQLEPLRVNAQPEQVAAKLQSLVEDSGLFFEKRLGEVLMQVGAAAPSSPPLADVIQLQPVRRVLQQDLKPSLLVAREQLGEDALDQANAVALAPQSGPSEGSDTDPISHSLDRMLSGIERQQQAACERLAAPELPVVFTWALPLAGTEQQGLLKLYCPRRGAPDGGDLKQLSLMVEMSRLGPIRADMLLNQRSLAVRFAVENQETCRRISLAVSELQEVLQPRFGTLSISVAVDRERLAAFGGAEPTGPGSSGVNLRI